MKLILQVLALTFFIISSNELIGMQKERHEQIEHINTQASNLRGGIAILRINQR